MPDSKPQERQLTGREKAVVMLLSLDEPLAVPIIAELDAEDIRRLREVATSMRGVPIAARDAVYRQFVDDGERAVALPRDGEQYLRRLTTKALGETKTHDLFFEGNRSALEQIAQADPEHLAGLLEQENPQLTAAILSQLDSERASKVLMGLPDAMRPTVLERLSRMTEVPATLLEELAGALSADLPTPGTGSTLAVNGVAASAALVRRLGRELGESLLAGIEGANDELAAEIRKAMYSFEDLLAVDKRQMRDLLKEVPQEQLALALKTASAEIQEHIFASMSKRAADLLREDIELLQGVRLSDVEGAQRQIVETALRLQAQGTIRLDSEGDVV